MFRALLVVVMLSPALALAQDATPSAATPTPTLAPADPPTASAATLTLPPEAPLDPRLEQPGETKIPEGGFLLGAEGPMIGPPRPVRFTRGRIAAMIAVPAGCMAIGGASYTGLVNQTGDAGTPALEMGAGYAGAWAGSGLFAMGVYGIDHDAFVPAGNRTALKWTVAGSAILAPIAAGAGTFAAGEWAEGRSPHPWESLAAAVGGAAVGELLSGGSSFFLKTPATSTPVLLAFVPVGAGSTLAYRLARGHFGREKPLVHAPLIILSARF